MVFSFRRRRHKSYTLFYNVFLDLIIYPRILQKFRVTKTIPTPVCLVALMIWPVATILRFLKSVIRKYQSENKFLPLTCGRSQTMPKSVISGYRVTSPEHTHAHHQYLSAASSISCGLLVAAITRILSSCDVCICVCLCVRMCARVCVCACVHTLKTHTTIKFNKVKQM